MKNKRKKGFSLVELLVVISIIAILTAILMPNLMGARERARDAKRKQDLDAIKTALRLFYNDVQNYPIAATSQALGDTLASYLPNAAGVGFTYTRLDSDGFQLCSVMESYNSEDLEASRTACQRDMGAGNQVCGLATGSDGAKKLFVVCAW